MRQWYYCSARSRGKRIYTEKIFEKIMAKNSPNLVEDKKPTDLKTLAILK